MLELNQMPRVVTQSQTAEHQRQKRIVIKYNMTINGWICAKWIVQSYKHTGILIQSGFSVVCIDLGALQHKKPPKTKNQTHLLCLRTKNVNFNPPKGNLPLIFFQQNFIYIILGCRWVDLDTYIGQIAHLKNGHFPTEPPNTMVLTYLVHRTHILSTVLNSSQHPPHSDVWPL